MTALFVVACGSTKQQVEPEPKPAPAKETPLSFGTIIDTVDTSHEENDAAVDSQNDRNIRFMVQIGAFQDPANASAVQILARDRYRTPVLNDYHTGLKLYQVRIGFFEDYKSASQFRTKMIQEHPEDYRDAWIVQLKR
jgi:cell division protein FtsN